MSVGLERESIMPDSYSGPQEASWRGIAHNTRAPAAGLRCKLQRCFTAADLWPGVLPLGMGKITI